MPIPQHSSILIQDRSAIGEARRIASQMAERARLNESDLGRVPLVVTELATNLLVHAHGGEILLRVLPVEFGTGVEVIALDRGPGIADIRRCLEDGYSSIGSRGCGLGAVRRLSTTFDIYSTQPAGTVVLSRLQSANGKTGPGPLFSAICDPVSGETDCGDSWQVRCSQLQLAVLVVDGLGHGPLAAIAAGQALDVFERDSLESPTSYLESSDAALRSTRGAAVAVGQIDLKARKLSYAGIGNISGVIISSDGSTRSLISHNGTIGAETRKIQQFDYDWREGDLLVMHSDGIGSRWRLSDYPGLMRAHTGIIAAVVYRDSRRVRDDATVLVVRLSSN